MMSWSITFIGKPESIEKALNEQSEKLTGQSKEEFDAALPHLIGLVNQNYNSNFTPVLRISANGHGYKNESNSYGSCNVSIEPLNGALV